MHTTLERQWIGYLLNSKIIGRNAEKRRKPELSTICRQLKLTAIDEKNT